MKVNDDNRSIRDLDCFGDPLPTDDDKAIVEKYHSTDYETPQVPKNDVIEDMGNECGIISSAARDYIINTMRMKKNVQPWMKKIECLI